MLDQKLIESRIVEWVRIAMKMVKEGWNELL